MHREEAAQTQLHAGREFHLVQIDQEDGLVFVTGIVQLVFAVGGSEILPCNKRDKISAAHDDAGNVLIPFTPGDQTLVIPDAVA